MERQVITTAEEFFNQHEKDVMKIELDHVCLTGEKDKILVLSDNNFGGELINRLKCSQIENVEFNGFYFGTTIFSHCEFRKVKFKDCQFSCSVFSYSEFDTVEFINCRFNGTTFDFDLLMDSNFTNCVFNRSISRFFYCQILAYFKTITFFSHCNIRTRMYLEDCKLDAMIAQKSAIYLTNNHEDLKLIDVRRLGNGDGDNNQIPYLTIGPVGSRNDFVSYIPEINWVKCGCWREDEINIYLGGSLEAFKERVLSVYPEEGTYYHDEYMAAIKIFETARKKFLGQAVAV